MPKEFSTADYSVLSWLKLLPSRELSVESLCCLRQVCAKGVFVISTFLRDFSRNSPLLRYLLSIAMARCF